MKKTLTIIKTVFALSTALILGVLFGTSIDVLDKQANAIESTMEFKSSNQPKEQPLAEEDTDIRENLPKGTDSTTEKPVLTEELVYEALLSFEAPIYWAIADNDVLVDYTSTEQLLKEHYAKFANLDLARSFVYAFFLDQEGQVILLPGQLQTIFKPEVPIEMNQVTEDQYQVKQAEKGYDGTTIYRIYEFKFYNEENVWKFENILYE